VCGDDGCGGTCGACGSGEHCSFGECALGVAHDADELWAMYHINQFRTGPGPIPTTCNHDGPTLIFPDPGPIAPSRLNADMVQNTRLFAQHVVEYCTTTGQGFCGHTDPLMPTAPYRKDTYFGEVGLQNAWCGYVPPEAAPITGDPWHCGNMLAGDANEWGLGHKLAASGAGYQVQDIGTDHAYLTMLIENEALTTSTPNVKVFVLGKGIYGADDPLVFSRPFRFMGDVVEVQLSEDPCFGGAPWQPWAPLLDFTLSPGDGRKVVYARARDQNGATFVTWDSIYLGPEPPEVNALEEAISRLRSVRIPPLTKDGFDAFQYTLGAYREAEDTGVWWGYRESVPDAAASGGAALRLGSPGQEGGLARVWMGAQNAVPVGSGEIVVRVRSSDTGSHPVFGISYREDSGAPAGQHLDVLGSDFVAADAYQEFRLPYDRVLDGSLFYIEFWGSADVLIDRIEIWSTPLPTGGAGLSIDFSSINYRGMEIRTRFVHTATGQVEPGPSINPYCALCL
jgi:hypothetical protein